MAAAKKTAAKKAATKKVAVKATKQTTTAAKLERVPMKFQLVMVSGTSTEAILNHPAIKAAKRGGGDGDTRCTLVNGIVIGPPKPPRLTSALQIEAVKVWNSLATLSLGAQHAELEFAYRAKPA